MATQGAVLQKVTVGDLRAGERVEEPLGHGKCRSTLARDCFCRSPRSRSTKRIDAEPRFSREVPGPRAAHEHLAGIGDDLEVPVVLARTGRADESTSRRSPLAERRANKLRLVADGRTAGDPRGGSDCKYALSAKIRRCRLRARSGVPLLVSGAHVVSGPTQRHDGAAEERFVVAAFAPAGSYDGSALAVAELARESAAVTRTVGSPCRRRIAARRERREIFPPRAGRPARRTVAQCQQPSKRSPAKGWEDAVATAPRNRRVRPVRQDKPRPIAGAAPARA